LAIVLIAEDEEDERELLAGFVRQKGHTPLQAKDGVDALELMRDRHVDMLVTDLAMPRMNGLRLIRSVRDSGDTIPIIAVSGKNADQLLLAQDYGANGAVSKPVHGPEFKKLMERILEDTRSDWSSAWIHPEFGSVGDH
jgi:two-component system response regulator